MAAKDEKAGFVALSRFGFGPRGDGDLDAASLDPRGFLRAEIEQPGAALLAGPGLPDSNAALQILFAQQDAEKAAREAKAALAAASATPAAAAPAPAASPAPPPVALPANSTQIIVLARQTPMVQTSLAATRRRAAA